MKTGAPIWIKNKVVLIALTLATLVGLSFIVPLLVPFRESLAEYLGSIWWAILLGLLIGGAVDHYVPDEMISHLLARKKKRTIFTAVVLGFLLSACSHGILALSIELHKKGAATSSVIAFLLASPWANLPLTIMLFGFFGSGALFIILAALLVGINTGFIFQVLEKRGWVESNTNKANPEGDGAVVVEIRKWFRSLRDSDESLADVLRGTWNGAVSLGNMVMWWILLGIGLASLAGAYVPHVFFQNYLGSSFLGLLATLFVATVLEVCSEGSAPMAFELFRQTGALGNSFVFLMAGVATDYTEIGLLWSNVGRRAALLLPIVTVPQVILLGWLANVWL